MGSFSRKLPFHQFGVCREKERSEAEHRAKTMWSWEETQEAGPWEVMGTGSGTALDADHL